MDTPTSEDWIALNPSFKDSDRRSPDDPTITPEEIKQDEVDSRSVTEAYCLYAALLTRQMASTASSDDLSEKVDALTEQREDLIASAPIAKRSKLKAALHVLSDVVRKGWAIQPDSNAGVQVRRPDGDARNPSLEKRRIRKQKLIKRDEQLSTSSVRTFIEGMERMSNHRGSFVSILSLMRDGRELASALRATRESSSDDLLSALRHVVDPYVQLVVSETRCEHTGLRLQDIWRYFRHTWSNQYTSTPGRTMSFLVRDRAREYHPVIGIGSLGSPIVQIRERDTWIGWQAQSFIEHVTDAPSAEIGLWLYKVLDTAIDELYVEDFLTEKRIFHTDLRHPTPDVIERLRAYGAKQRDLHHRLSHPREHHKNTGADSDGAWIDQATSHLYRSKRALALADYLDARRVLTTYVDRPPTAEQVAALLAQGEGRKIVKKLLRKAKADRVGIAMADVTVCGAIPPYSPILGGKLVAMLAASPEIVVACRERYAQQESVIASSMAGRSIVRPSNLVFMGTTSLYGVGSSQYNRLRMPADRVGGHADEQVAYLELGKSDSYGTSQFSSDTLDALVSILQQSTNGQRVNSIFGEGVSPKLRKIRDGFGALNLPADALLQHGRQRIVYGIPLARNLREYLLGMDDEPVYIFSLNAPQESTQAIGTWWMERWLSMRIQSDVVLDRVAQHTLVYPIRHGAKVPLPPTPEPQYSLFDDLDIDA